jgi:phosphoglycerate dehydrogenase-like enzyme
VTTVFVGGVPGAVARLTEEFPDITVIDLRGYGGEIPSDAVLFASHLSAEGLKAAESGVTWNALPYTGIDSAHPAHLSAKVVTCARGALAEPIAEYVFATILAKNRNFPEFWIKEPPPGKWAWNIQERELHDGRSIQPLSLSGQRLSIFGFGGIGQQIARLGLAFGMEVVACRRSDTPSEVAGVRLVKSIQELTPEADHLVLCAPHTTSTEGIVDAALLQSAKPGLHLINVARGTLINDDALKNWLDHDGAARASLDVCEPEPLFDRDHWLYHHDQVFLTPHSSWMGQPYMASALEQFCANLHRYLKGEPLEGVVDLSLGY